jgi:hypothetical protein
MTGDTGGRRASREEAEDMSDRLIVRPIPQGSGMVWLIEPVEGSPGGAPGAWPGSSGGAAGAGGATEKDETIRILREQVDFLQAEVQDRKRELRAEQEARRREVAALHELLALAGGRDARREDEGRREGTPPPAPSPTVPTVPAPRDGAAPAPGPGSGAAAPAESWWRRVLGRRGELP